MSWLSPDSRFMEAWNNMTDGILINIYMMITSIPLITIGASLAAGNVAARKRLEGQGSGGVAKTYFTAFKENFLKATGVWIPYFVVLVLSVWLWVFVHIPELLIIKFALIIVWVIGFEWAFALEARFDNTVSRTVWNSLIFGVSHIGYTLGLIAIDGIFVGVFVATWKIIPPALFLVVVFGYGSMLMLHEPLTERVFKRYI
ncbi:DUF624 domain-containing protein [Alloscardovia venturai]|uniref:DUF624 domain-containing protein n=1 Tax=Alloscardovia venturai TaxID=1769421 RepID=A0ABW2Y5S6_9BIFI